MRVAFVVPGPPVPKARARVVNGHAFTPKRTADYEKHVQKCAMAALSRVAWRTDAPAYALRVVVHRAARRGDLDNFIKACSDALNGVAWVDDARVLELWGRMGVDPARPRVEVEIEDFATAAGPIGREDGISAREAGPEVVDYTGTGVQRQNNRRSKGEKVLARNLENRRVKP